MNEEHKKCDQQPVNAGSPPKNNRLHSFWENDSATGIIPGLSEINSPVAKPSNSYTRFFIDHPFKIYILCLVFYFGCIGACIGLNLIEATTPHSHDNLVWDDERVIGYDYETLLTYELDKASTGSDLSVRVHSPSDWVTQIVYDCECDNIITVENVKRMASIEAQVLQLPNWHKLC